MTKGFESCFDKNQPNTVTVEDKLFEAMEKVTMIRDRTTAVKELGYSKAGRTDTGVSAMCQVVSLKIRKMAGRPFSADDPSKLCKILNRSLPGDIRVLDCAFVDASFNARFDCLSREYLYFFMKRTLDVDRMNEACKLLKGKHDFRNICKLNVIQNESYVREVLEAGIFPAHSIALGADPWHFSREQMLRDEQQACVHHTGPLQMFYLRIKATAFVWHQVLPAYQIRCIMTVLYSVGAGHDEPSVISKLLDLNATPAKPGYNLAPPEPLMLSHCEYAKDPFSKVDQHYHCSPANVLSEQMEAILTQYYQTKACLSTVLSEEQKFFQTRRDREGTKSLLQLQKGKTIDEKIDGLQGNKKKRFNNFKDWRERTFGAKADRSRSRSREKPRSVERGSAE